MLQWRLLARNNFQKREVIISEYHIVDCDFKDEECLLEALKDLGYTPTVHDTPINLEGYRGDKREQKAHIIIPRKQVGGASNDVGFERVAGKYRCHASEYDRAWRTGGKLNKLKQLYGEKVIMKTVSRHSKYSFRSRKVDEEGNIKIKVRRL